MVEHQKERLLLLVGSPRKKGTSHGFARTLQHLAAESGITAEIDHLYDYYDGRRPLAQLRERCAEATLIGMVAPLYYDTLPGAVVAVLEQLDREGALELQGKGLFVVGQSAYPFPDLMEPMFDQCRHFGDVMGMRWLGGAGYGGGVMIDGTPLEALGSKGQKLTGALRSILDDLLAGRMIDPAPLGRLTMRIPKLLYRPVALPVLNFRTWYIARKGGVPTDFGGQVYLK